MDRITPAARAIQAIGFQCIRCGSCCTAIEENSNIVMLSPQEIREIGKRYGFTWNEIAEPYPGVITDQQGRSFTIGWCLTRKESVCSFLSQKTCRIYDERPWICRTYPFELVDGRVRTSPCPGLGRSISWEDAVVLAKNLVRRSDAELSEEEEIRQVLQNESIPSGVFAVVDCEGIKTVK